MRAYDHRKIEKKWQKKWASAKLYKTPDKAPGKKNYFLLTEFPYPSGNLHVGHWYAFAVPDILARALRMQGKNVMYPVGFDAFGLPAENAAIKNKLNPRIWTYKNIAYMKKQMASMGTSFDWSREVITCDPAYYKWTQWQFLQFFKNGLAYRKETSVNWCPKDKTVLANEQVVNGKCERCDCEVVQRQMLQWNLKITDYADRLVDDLTALDWPEQIKESQRNWIGRSEGAEIDFPLDLGLKPGKALILHGFEGSPETGWRPWLKNELEKYGWTVHAPAWPDAEHPKYETVMDFLRKETADFGENDIVIGHSLGAHFAMKLAEEKIIGRLVIVAPTFANSGLHYNGYRKAWPESDVDALEHTIEKNPVDFSKLRARSKVALFSTNDPYIPVSHADQLDSSWQKVMVHGMQHMSHQPKILEIFEYVVPAIRVFTTRADTLFGATYLVLAPEHRWVTLALEHKTVLKNNDEVHAYVANAGKKTELERMTEQKDKTGIELKGVTAINPATGEKIPVYVADYVLAHYGTGAIMAVPAHDERDNAFAKKFGLPIREVVEGGGASLHTGDGMLKHSGEFSGAPSAGARQKMVDAFGLKKTTYKLRDWIVSRQRYWGVPIPIVHCKQCGEVAVPDKDLPVKLPEIKDYLPEGSGKSPLAKAKGWVKVKCPKCKAWAERETDTLDTFVDSSWYFIRYADPKNKKAFADKKKMLNWMPVDRYSGGAEHTTMHVLYSRFWQKALYDLKLVKDSEPYTRRMNRGLIMGPDGQKMSKSRGNVIDPDDVVSRLGADTVRMYLAFIGPYNEVGSYPWNPDGVVGVRRFLERVWRLRERLVKKTSDSVERAMHQAIRKATDDVQLLKFNTAIAALMSFLNDAEKEGIAKKEYETLLRLIAPFAPHMAEELWAELKHKKSVHLEKWPKYDEKKLISDTVTIAVQVNGKVRTQISAAKDAGQEDVRKLAEAAASKWMEGRSVARAIVVPNRLINLVLAQN